MEFLIDNNSTDVLLFVAATAAVEGRIGKKLKKVLRKIKAEDAHAQLAVADEKLGKAIKVRCKFRRQCLG